MESTPPTLPAQAPAYLGLSAVRLTLQVCNARTRLPADQCEFLMAAGATPQPQREGFTQIGEWHRRLRIPARIGVDRLSALSVGDVVFWTDPDDGICSGHRIVAEIVSDSGTVESDETVVRLSDNGSVTEAYVCELSAPKPGWGTQRSMTAQHTPGPWTAEKPRWTSPTDEMHVYDQRGQQIARIPLAGPYQSINEAKANARLMAAAPKLLSALQDLLGHEDDPSIGWWGRAQTSPDHFRCEHCKAEGLDCSDLPHAPDCRVVKAREAIAEATATPVRVAPAGKPLPAGVQPGEPVNAQGCYYTADGMFMNSDGTRSVFDDVDDD